MAEYSLLTIWHIDAPLEAVYAAILDSRRWPDWWPCVQSVEEVAAGNAEGINSVWRYSWQGVLPYRVVFEVCATRIETLVAIEGTTQGDLEGVGRWDFQHDGKISIVRCEWHVRSTKWWMNLLAPVARRMFIRNHALVMARGAEGLARQLRSRLVSQETIDLMAATSVVTSGPPATLAPRPERVRIDPAMLLFAGLVAGVVATVAQIVLWWLAGIPVLAIFFRDARLTAALVMGEAVLQPASMPQWDVLLVATLIHFTLSTAYAAIPALWAGRLRTWPARFAGASYGLAIYLLNLYGFTLLFPWFAVARDWVTLVAHLVFGVTLAEGCRLFARASAQCKRGVAQDPVVSE